MAGTESVCLGGAHRLQRDLGGYESYVESGIQILVSILIASFTWCNNATIIKMHV